LNARFFFQTAFHLVFSRVRPATFQISHVPHTHFYKIAAKQLQNTQQRTQRWHAHANKQPLHAFIHTNVRLIACYSLSHTENGTKPPGKKHILHAPQKPVFVLYDILPVRQIAQDFPPMYTHVRNTFVQRAESVHVVSRSKRFKQRKKQVSNASGTPRSQENRETLKPHSEHTKQTISTRERKGGFRSSCIPGQKIT
jgi:hypothetical protein